MNPLSNRVSKIPTVLAVAFMCCLAIGPTIKAILETQLSARYLIAALQELESGDFDSSRKSLETAVDWSDKIATSDELIQIQMYYWVLGGEPEKAIAEITKAKGLERFDFAANAYSLFFTIGDFANALICAKVLLEHPQLSTVEKLNQTAYVRSLAKVELDKALQDIETAVKVDNSPSVVDTQAWVLHELGRNEEALVLMNDAIARAEKALPSKKSDQPTSAKQSDSKKSDAAGESVSKTEDAASIDNGQDEARMKNIVEIRKAYVKDENNPLKTLAVMRFHRATIREALDQDASEDWKWLEDNGFTNKSTLY